MPVNEQKSLLRQSLKTKRAALAENQRAASDHAICERLLDSRPIQQANTVFCYVSSGDEVNTRPVIEQLMQMNKTVAIPKIINREKMIPVEFKDWGSLSPGPLGIPAPDSSIQCPAKIDLCITPGLGFTTRGQRIGFGRGYYDRWLRDKPEILKIALSYECQIVEDIPTADTDVPVDQIITEERLITVNQTPPPGVS